MTRILSIDFGERRIGIALSDTERIIASPLTTLDTRQTGNPIEAIAHLCQEHEVGLIVVGYPLHLDGHAGEKAAVVDQFIETLKTATPSIPIEKVDERYSSLEAHALLKGRKRKKGRTDKNMIDRVAAALFLQEYLNAR